MFGYSYSQHKIFADKINETDDGHTERTTGTVSIENTPEMDCVLICRSKGSMIFRVLNFVPS